MYVKGTNLMVQLDEFPMCFLFTQVTATQLKIETVSSPQKAPSCPCCISVTHPAEWNIILTFSPYMSFIAEFNTKGIIRGLPWWSSG